MQKKSNPAKKAKGEEEKRLDREAHNYSASMLEDFGNDLTDRDSCLFTAEEVKEAWRAGHRYAKGEAKKHG